METTRLHCFFENVELVVAQDLVGLIDMHGVRAVHSAGLDQGADCDGLALGVHNSVCVQHALKDIRGYNSQ